MSLYHCMISNVSVFLAITLDTYCSNTTQNTRGFKLSGTTLKMADEENNVGMSWTVFQLSKKTRKL